MSSGSDEMSVLSDLHMMKMKCVGVPEKLCNKENLFHREWKCSLVLKNAITKAIEWQCPVGASMSIQILSHVGMH